MKSIKECLEGNYKNCKVTKYEIDLLNLSFNTNIFDYFI